MINIQDNIAEMSVGNISIGSAYVGNQLVWQKEQDDYDPMTCQNLFQEGFTHLQQVL